MERSEFGRWVREFSASITVCDAAGTILELNDQAARTFSRSGGQELVGRSLFDCHPEPACSLLRQLLVERRSNTYTIEKGGVRKLIHQAPWYDEGEFGGLVELSIVLPEELPHHVRQPAQ